MMEEFRHHLPYDIVRNEFFENKCAAKNSSKLLKPQPRI